MTARESGSAASTWTVEVPMPACPECDHAMVPVVVRENNVLGETFVRRIDWCCLECEAEEAEARRD